MHIIQIGPYPISLNCIRGGVESSVFGLTQELVRQGHTVFVFDVPRCDVKDQQVPLVTGEGQGRGSIYRYHNPGSHNEDALARVPDMVRDIVSCHPDVVHVHGTGALSAAIYSAVKGHGIPVLLTIHGLLRVEKQNKLKLAEKRPWKLKALAKAIYQFVRQGRVECNLLESAGMAIVDTGYLLDALQTYPVRHLPQLHVIPQGANEKYYPKDIDANWCSIDEHWCSKTILCVGTFSQRKSQLELIRAFELLRSHGVEARLELCGIVAEQPYFEKVRTAVEASAFKSDIAIFENLAQEELMEHYKHAHIFALHSQEESQGIVFAEAMAMGLPVVSTLVGGIPYVVHDGECGLLSPYGDVEAMAHSLEKMMTDEIVYKKMSSNACAAAETYRWSRIAHEVLDLYNQIR